MRTPLSIAFVVLALSPAAPAGSPDILVDGKFGRAVEGSDAPEAEGRDEYSVPPLSVECWANLRSKGGFNLLVASEPKESGGHWEIYSYAGSGFYSAYLPDFAPAENVSKVDITDGKWHALAMTFDGARVALFVDGKQVLDSAVKRQGTMERKRGPLSFGTAHAGGQKHGCDGRIDEVRISRVLRTIAAAPPAPFEADADTIGLWHFDQVGPGGEIADESKLKNDARLDPRARVALDEIDRESYHAGPAPLESQAAEISLQEGSLDHPAAPPVLSLDGTWEMARGGDAPARLSGPWADAIPAEVPGSVHAALQKAGKIPDPKFGKNDAIAHAMSFETWWLRKTFPKPPGGGHRLVFGGVAIHGTFWLNGKKLGEHEGMFGGPEFEVAGVLEDKNTLVVKIDPAPGDPKAWNNQDWRKTVVFNNVWGWHYSSIPALGIWRPVRVEAAPAVRIEPPFIAARDTRKGTADLIVQLHAPASGFSGKLRGSIQPETFKGKAYRFLQEVKSDSAEKSVHLRFSIPDPRPWWPNGLGSQDLYRLRLSFAPEGGGADDARDVTFGLRTIEMAPLPGGPRSSRYNWTFVVNGRPTFMKGAGWCTMDSSMDFSRERYDRFLTLARIQNVQMVRAWGSGMPETDEFYDLCDRKGILVFQEWPTAWDSHLVQPYDVLEETVRLNTRRLRNHPSLAVYGGGNESGNPFGKAIDMMGRLAIELDGTRPFHRGEPWGGSAHNYDCYWGWQPLDHNLTLTAPFFGEFGLACMPVLESVHRYLPDDEWTTWPPPADGSLAHHTPIFNTAEDLKRLFQYARYFTPADDLTSFITGSQLSQAVGLRHTLELARTRWPQSTGALYYKLNDNYPAASWSTIDWYGAPKIGHSFVQAAFAPLHVCAIFPSLNLGGKAAALPIYLLDDANTIAPGRKWEVQAQAYNETLQSVKLQYFPGSGGIDRVKKLGELTLSKTQTESAPLLLVVDIKFGGTLADRTFYFANYESVPGSLFKLPRTRLTLKADGGRAVVTNSGAVPAVGVELFRPGNRDRFTADRNFLWLDPGESQAMGVNETAGLHAGAWNAEAVEAGR